MSNAMRDNARAARAEAGAARNLHAPVTYGALRLVRAQNVQAMSQIKAASVTYNKLECRSLQIDALEPTNQVCVSTARRKDRDHKVFELRMARAASGMLS